MAAYASLVSLRTLIDQLQHHPRPPITLDKQRVESLCKSITFLQEFLETYSHDAIQEAAQGLERHIAKVAYAAADVIEFHIADQIRGTMNIERLNRYLQGVLEDTSLVVEAAMQVTEKLQDQDRRLHRFSISDDNLERPTLVRPNPTAMVGFDDVFKKVLDKLTGNRSRLQIIPIVGMGGIGKTTLATRAYEHQIVMQHFDIRSWVIVSQDYNILDLLSKLLDRKESENKSVEELGQELYQSLFGWRYLVVLDDMWSDEVWDRINRFFPDNNDKSRIIVTTRLSFVASRLSKDNILVMNFLDEHKSWSLLCNVVFGEDVCPTELEDSGRKIAKECKGLPLSIVVMGGLLAKSKQSQRDWEFVAEKLNSSMNFEHEQLCSQIIRTSYYYMPIHLKPCFLYMGAFIEDREISISDLIKQWVDEGFVKSISGKSLELVAEECLTDLIDRNLLLVKRVGYRGEIKACSIHDVTRELCIKKAEEEGFLCVIRERNLGIQQGIHVQRRIAIHGRSLKGGNLLPLNTLRSTSLVHSVMCDTTFPHFSTKMWRILNVTHIPSRLEEHARLFFDNINLPINLRFFAIRFASSSFMRFSNKVLYFPISIYRFWNLQTLIIDNHFHYIEADIWIMHQLKHVKVYNITPSSPPRGVKGDDFVLPNLQTLSRVRDFKFSKEVIKRIPSIRKLSIYVFPFSIEELLEYELSNLGCLQQLESLSCDLGIGNSGERRIVSLEQIIAFPHSLTKLKLMFADLRWEEVTSVIGSLPHLQSLTLIASGQGTEWNTVEGKFQRLRFLSIQISGLEYWTSESDHFPCLERLSLSSFLRLKEIPSEIADAPKLQTIELEACSNSAVNSAQKILDEQDDVGNATLKLRVWDYSVNCFVERHPHSAY